LLAEVLGRAEVERVNGGETRTQSVRAGLEALAQGRAPELVLIHDAARPGIDRPVIDAVLEALKVVPAAAPGLAVADALKRVRDGALTISEDVARAQLWRVQTPQGFHFAPLLAAYRALRPEAAYDDDIAVARAAGLEARLVAGAERLAKVTYPEDLAMMEQRLSPTTPCVGAGFDAHRFGPGDHVTLCGVRIAHTHGLVGHSDADAGWHALTDALLGAIGDGDIGAHFPPSDPQWRGANSERFLRHAAELVSRAGGRITHVDMTLICERPKIGPHREAMRLRTAEVLALPLQRVSVKATTTERMGFTGREEGLAAQATATVVMP
jgi:2-C-methyl-D-erythritol 4-phosphate cytidylyltransferase / 2-C-methyl-D-erythritol 2,4-cyclodiphosphate synthase